MKTIHLKYWFKNGWMRNYIITNSSELGISPVSKIVKVSAGYYADVAAGKGFELSPTFKTLKECKAWILKFLETL